MIKKAVFSYFNPDESFGNASGFKKYSDFLFTTALSVLCASRHFPEVQFISSDWGVDVMKDLLVFTRNPKFKCSAEVTYSNKLNEMKNVSRYFWAYGKLLAYNEQTTPFVHLDNDVFLWDPLAPRILKARLCFQSHEPMDKIGYHYYNLLRPCFNKAKVRPQVIVDNPVHDFAYNCGICGGHDLDFFKEWIKCSREYIFAPENQKLFFERFGQVIIHQNLFHEQYFAASLIKMHDMRGEVKVINKDAIKTGQDAKHKYTHYWGTTKRDRSNMARVRWRLHDEDLSLYNRVDDFCRNNNL